MARRSGDTDQRAMQLVFSAGDEGILQSDLWKKLGLSSREGSRLAQKFEEKGVIERRRVLHEGRWTFRLYSKRQQVTLVSIEDNPCFSCDEIDRCFLGGVKSPVKCDQLDVWIEKNTGKTVKLP